MAETQKTGAKAPMGRASEGFYGAKTWSRTSENARALLEGIREYFADAPSFTREDLLTLPAFDNVATITRYVYISAAVHELLATNQVIAPTRSELCLVSQKRQFQSSGDLVDVHQPEIERVAKAAVRGGSQATVMQVAQRWKCETPLTNNIKRVVVRKTLRRMAAESRIAQLGRNLFAAPAPANGD